MYVTCTHTDRGREGGISSVHTLTGGGRVVHTLTGVGRVVHTLTGGGRVVYQCHVCHVYTH